MQMDLVAPNLDPQTNTHPEKLDLERRLNRHIAFDTGIHFCLGHRFPAPVRYDPVDLGHGRSHHASQSA
jgi:hypothetical protein